MRWSRRRSSSCWRWGSSRSSTRWSSASSGSASATRSPSFQGLLNYARMLQRRAALGGGASHGDHHRRRAADRARARPAACLSLPRRPPAEAPLRRAPHHPVGDLADGRRLDVAADVRRPLRPDQPDHRLGRSASTSRSCGRSTSAWAYPAIIICDVWQWTPFMFIILLAALANVDQEQLDAASIDGANRWQAFRNVTAPGDLAGDDDRASDPRARPRSASSTSSGSSRAAGRAPPPRPSRSTPTSAVSRSSTRAMSAPSSWC